jgi:LacI family transcriptional regulator
MSIHKVAEIAGVSASTVSRVINKHPRVAPETEQAVRKAMVQLGYEPSDRRPGPKPQSRRTGTATVAFLVLGGSPERATPAFQELLFGVSTGASSHDADLVFSHVPDVEHLPVRLLDQKVDGLLLHGALPAGALRDRLHEIPTVWLMGNRRRPEWGDQVMPDGYAIGELAAKHLMSLGHRDLVFLNLDEGHWPFRLSAHGFQVTASDAGANVELVQYAPKEGGGYWRKHTAQAVESLVDQYLALRPRPTGIFVADDMQVAMIQPALQHRGVEIGPGKCDVISCNNERPYLVGLTPVPSEIDFRAAAIGRRGVEQLMWRLSHPEVAERIVSTIEPQLVPASRPAAG